MITGGCLCGATRYEIDTKPRFTSYCHCEDCRKANGAPVVMPEVYFENGIKIIRCPRMYAEGYARMRNLQ